MAHQRLLFRHEAGSRGRAGYSERARSKNDPDGLHDQRVRKHDGVDLAQPRIVTSESTGASRARFAAGEWPVTWSAAAPDEDARDRSETGSPLRALPPRELAVLAQVAEGNRIRRYQLNLSSRWCGFSARSSASTPNLAVGVRLARAVVPDLPVASRSHTARSTPASGTHSASAPARPFRTRSCLRSSPVSQPTASCLSRRPDPTRWSSRSSTRRAPATGNRSRHPGVPYARHPSPTRSLKCIPTTQCERASRPPTTGTRRLAGCTASSVAWIATGPRSPCAWLPVVSPTRSGQCHSPRFSRLTSAPFAMSGQRSVTLQPREAAVVYDLAENVSRAFGEPFPLQFTPVRCNRGRAMQFERVALSAGEILHLVHDGFFGLAHCREAAIEAVQACGGLPAPALGLPPLPRHATRATAESYVDTLIEREPELHRRQAADSAGSAT